MKKIIWSVVISISMLIIMWFSVSYAEVISKNNTGNPEYSRCNAFVVISEMGGK